MKSRNLIGGLLAGAAMGVAVGMLLAPASGKKIQKKLSKKSQRLLENLKGGAAESASYLKGKYSEGIEEVTKKGRAMGDMIGEKVTGK